MAEHAENSENESTQASMSWDDLMREIADEAHLTVDSLDDDADDIKDTDIAAALEAEKLSESEFEDLIEADDLNDLEQQLSMDQESLFEPDSADQGLETSDIFDEEIVLGNHDMPDPLLQDALDEELATVSEMLNDIDDLGDDETLSTDLRDDTLNLDDKVDLSDLLGDLDIELNSDPTTEVSDDDTDLETLFSDEISTDLETSMIALGDNTSVENEKPLKTDNHALVLSKDLSEVSDILADDSHNNSPNPVPEQQAVNLSSLAQPLVDQMAKLSLSFGQIIQAPDDSEILYHALKDYADGLEGFWQHVNDYVGLNHFCQFIQDNSLILAQLSKTERQQYSLLERWPGIMLNYLMIPEESIDELVDYIADEHWPKPLSLKELDILRLLLQQLAGMPTKAITPNLNLSSHNSYDDNQFEVPISDIHDNDIASFLHDDEDDKNDDYAVMMAALATETVNNDILDPITDSASDLEDHSNDYKAMIDSLNAGEEIVLDDTQDLENDIDINDLDLADPIAEQVDDYSDMMQALADENIKETNHIISNDLSEVMDTLANNEVIINDTNNLLADNTESIDDRLSDDVND